MENTVKIERPPGPPSPWFGLPLLRSMRKDYLGFTSNLQRKYGDITYMRIVNENAYDVFSPELVRELLVDNADALIRWERGIEIFTQSFGQSVLTTEGDTWQRQRRMLMPAFAPKRVAGYAQLMREAASTGLAKAVPKEKDSALVEMDALFSQLAMDVILRTMFGESATTKDAYAAAHATQTLSESAMREMFWPMTLPDWLPLPGKRAKRQALRVLRELVGRYITARERDASQNSSKDLLGELMALQDDATGERLAKSEIFDQCMVSFQAGHETTATTLLWWSQLMAEHPAAAARAQEEIERVLGGREPTPEDLPALLWLSATLKESLRLYPAVSALMSRRTTQNISLGAWRIPKGAMLRLTTWGLHRDPRAFDAPEQFRPERFLPDARPPPRGAYLPFGAGPRVCIGQHFAMLEMTLIAAMLLQRYRLELPTGATRPEAQQNVTLRPLGGVRLWLHRAQSAGSNEVV